MRKLLLLALLATPALATVEVNQVVSGGGGSGDVVGPASSVASEIALFDGTTGKLIKRASGTGVCHATSGVFSVGTVTVAEGGTNATTASGARTNLGAAASGANGDITSMTALGTVSSTAAEITSFESSNGTQGYITIDHATNAGFTLGLGGVGKYQTATVNQYGGTEPEYAVYSAAVATNVLSIDGNTGYVSVADGFNQPTQPLTVGGASLFKGTVNVESGTAAAAVFDSGDTVTTVTNNAGQYAAYQWSISDTNTWAATAGESSGAGGADLTFYNYDRNQNDIIIDEDNGYVGLGIPATTAPTAMLDVNSDTVRLRTDKTPASSTEACAQGTIAWDASYVYVCVATDTWKRTALATW